MGNVLGAAGNSALSAGLESAGLLAALGDNADSDSIYMTTPDMMGSNAVSDWVKRNIADPLDEKRRGFSAHTYEKADEFSQQASEHTVMAKDGLGLGGSLLVDAGIAGTQMAGDIGLAALTGGSALLPMGIRSFGSGAQQARQGGATAEQQFIFGLGSAAVEMLTEKIANVSTPFKKFGEGSLDDVIEGTIKNLAKTEAGQAALKALASAASEGGEEAISALVNPVLQTMTYDQSALKQYGDKTYWSDMLSQALVGGVLGLAGGVGDVPKALRESSGDAATRLASPQKAAGMNVPDAAATQTQGNPIFAPGTLGARIMGGGSPVAQKNTTSTEAAVLLPEQSAVAEAQGLPMRVDGAEYKVVEVPQSKVDEISAYVDGLSNADAKKKYKRILKNLFMGQKFANANTVANKLAYEIGIGSKGIGEIIARQPVSAETLAVLERLNDVVENAKYMASEPSTKNTNDIVRTDSFETGTLVGDKPGVAKMRVNVTPEGNKLYYATNIIEEGAPPAPRDDRSHQLGNRETHLDTTIINPTNGVVNSDYAQNAANDSLPSGVGAATAGFDQLGALVDQYGSIPEGEGPHSAERVTGERIPAQTAPDNRVSQTVRTAYEAPVTPNETAEKIEAATLGDLFSYQKATDKAALEAAEKTIRDKGWDTALTDWTSDVRGGKVGKDLTALGWTLYNNAANAGNAKAAVEILTDLVKSVRSGAQSTQAVRLLKKLSPESQLYAVQRSVQNLHDELRNKYGEKAPDLKIDDALALKYLDALNAKDDTAAKEALTGIYQQIASQVPSTFADKWNAWRYTAMLFNPVTHIKNIVGNYAFAGTRAVKNALSASVQTGANVIIKKAGGTGFEQTRAAALHKNDANDQKLMKDAAADYAKWSDEIYKVGKYDEAKNKINDYRTIFKNKALEGIRTFNTEALETEDMWVSRPAYIKALAGYLKANGETFQTADSGLMDRARSFAILEAQKAAYRDSNTFSDAIASFGRGKTKNSVLKGLQLAGEGIIPFRRTPANILVRGVEYSPIGLAKTIGVDSFRLSKGEITAAEYIDNLSEGFAGSALFGLGVFLASQGLLSVGGSGDDKEDALRETQGHQKYAINVGGKSYTIDWLAPAAMPLFMGAALYNLLADESSDGVTLESALKVGTDVTGPLLETSMLSSLNDFVEGFAYAKQQDENLIYFGIMQAAMSYLGQAVPTIGGRVARTTDPTRRAPFTDPRSGVNTDIQYFVQQQMGKIPGLASTKQPYVDQWGRTQESESLAGRVLQNFVSPGYAKDISVSPMETELLRLYNDYAKENSVNVLPPVTVRKYFSNNGGSVYMAAEEYTQYKKTSGHYAYNALTKLINSSAYKNMTDAEKAKAVSGIYSSAAEKVKTEVMEARGEMRIPSAADGEKIQSYVSSASITEKQAYSLYKALDALEPEAGKTQVSTYQKVKAVNSQGYASKQTTALVASFYTTHDTDGNVKSESLLPYLTISDRLISLYIGSEDSDFVSMTTPASFQYNNVTYDLTEAERDLFRDTYTKYFNGRATNLTRESKLKELRENAYASAKAAVIRGRRG